MKWGKNNTNTTFKAVIDIFSYLLMKSTVHFTKNIFPSARILTTSNWKTDNSLPLSGQLTKV